MGLNSFINDISEKPDPDHIRHKSWHRILLLIIAITIHNIPGLYTHLKTNRKRVDLLIWSVSEK